MQSGAHWGSRVAFIFATAAAAVGLGNIWRFPYLVGQNGGSAFVLTYLIAVAVLGLPLMLAEIVIGKQGRGNPTKAVTHLAQQSKRGGKWAWVGGLGVLASFLVLSYYLVISGWVLDYFVRAIAGQFYHATEASSLAAFTNLKNSPWQMLLSDTAAALCMVAVLVAGLKAGLERAVLILFPALVVILFLLLLYVIHGGYFMQGVHYLFTPDFSALTSKMVLQALGQAFFSLNIGLAVTMMFSAYLPEKTPLVSSAVIVTFVDTSIALLAGLIIFPIVFMHHLKPDAGPSLIFQTLPIAFGQIPGGYVVGCLFFILLFVAAFTSVISMLEPSIVWAMERFHWSRKKAVLLCAFVCWLLSIPSVLSFYAGHWQPMGSSFFEWMDCLTSRVLIPLSGLGVAIFVGWIARPRVLTNGLGWTTSGFFGQCWMWLLRIIAPIGILVILLKSTGVI
jgi:neurotransmitter:Na+ symporter, NSS family